MAARLRQIEGLERATKDVATTVTSDGERLQSRIDGVEIRRPPTHADERGTLTEIYDPGWGFTDDPLVYVYHVTIRPGQLKGWVMTGSSRTGGVLKIVLYDARTDSETFGSVNVFHVGSHDRALVSIPAGVYHAVQNVGAEEAAFVNLPSRPYDHADPDKHRLPVDNDVIPYRLTDAS